VTVLPPPGGGERTRVIVLGDSVAFGLGVSDDETFAHALDARDNGIEAANLAVQGYGPGQELLVLQGEGLRNGPDVVVLAFCLANDFAEALLPVALYDGRTAKPRLRLVGERLVLEDAGLSRSGPIDSCCGSARDLTCSTARRRSARPRRRRSASTGRTASARRSGTRDTPCGRASRSCAGRMH
jgi:hypothetical protein